MNDPATVEELNRRLTEQFPGMEILDSDVNPEITADVHVTVDTEDSTKDANEAAQDFADSESASGFDNVETDSKF